MFPVEVPERIHEEDVYDDGLASRGDIAFNRKMTEEVFMMELDDIRALVEIVRAKGFAQAARRLGLSKSIISRRIARLEDELGTVLFNRTTRGINLTEAGQECYERGQAILTQMTEAREAITFSQAEIAGRLRVSLPLSFGLRRMSRFLACIYSIHPRLELDVSYNDRTVDMLSEGFDVAVKMGRLKDSTLVARQVTSVKFILVASPEYLSRNGEPATPKDLEHHPCLIYTGGCTRQRWQFYKEAKKTVISPTGRLFIDNGEGLVQAVEAGLGIAALSDFIVIEGLESGRLVHVLPSFSMQESPLYVVRPPGARSTAKIRAFTELFISSFGAAGQRGTGSDPGC
ncbi:LysR family transcriptional regulator [Paraburkholderia sp. 2C]|jgi:DNA-binding transcriptional LysR family regulator